MPADYNARSETFLTKLVMLLKIMIRDKTCYIPVRAINISFLVLKHNFIVDMWQQHVLCQREATPRITSSL